MARHSELQSSDVYLDDRLAMVDHQLARRGIADDNVLEAMKAVPREEFLPEDLHEFAYHDTPLPIGADQTISQPYIVARMVELARISPGDKVLEVGAGSGYAAAVISKLAEKVFAIERHEQLAEHAKETLNRLGYGNAHVSAGDGTKGWPSESPFDVIIISAGGRLPEPLRRQVAIGGRIILPLATNGHQVLTELVKTDDGSFTITEHEAVRFVPLVTSVEEVARESEAREEGPGARIGREPPDLSTVMARGAEGFDTYEDLAHLAERFADRSVICLGESTHGTSEFYKARAAITEHLVRHHGFTIVATEADWPDAAVYDRAIRSGVDNQPASQPFTRFPRWMWRNDETWALLRALKDINDERPAESQAAFYGLDVYSLCASIEAVLSYLEEHEPEAAAVARERYACLTPFCSEPVTYGRMRINDGYRGCERAVVRVLVDLFKQRVNDGEALFDAEQNARLVADAERYYRAVFYGSAVSWNLRDQHMFETLTRAMEHRGPNAKAIVWAHNSHLGDARATEMGWQRDEHNLGQLVREAFGEDCALIGFSTNEGEVAAADDWDGPMQVKTVLPGLEDSHEDHANRTELPQFFLDLEAFDDPSADLLSAPKLQRAIGVVYRPETERASHYFTADLASQFDAWVWFKRTHPVHARPVEPAEGADDTFPFGV